MKGEMSFWQHVWAPYGSHYVIFDADDSQIAHKIPGGLDFLCSEKEIIYYVFIADEVVHSLPWIYKIGGRKFMNHIQAT